MAKVLVLALTLVLLGGVVRVWAADVPLIPPPALTAKTIVLNPTVSPSFSVVPVTPTLTPYCQPTVVTAAPYTGPSMEMTPAYYVIRTPQDWSNYNTEIPIGAVDLTQQMLIIFPDEAQPGFKPRQVEIRSACVLSDRIEIDYFYSGDLLPAITPVVTGGHHRHHGTRVHAVAVILPQSDLPIDSRLR